MDPVTVSIVISAPREEVFDYLADIANHPEFTDHYLRDWHLTRIDSVGLGAGARFRVKAPGNRYSWADVTLTDVERPQRIVEVGRTGKSNRVRTLGVWELAPASGGGTRLSFTLQTAPATFADRLIDALGSRAFTRRNGRRALHRLREILEDSSQEGAARDRGRRVTVAGG